MNLRPFLAQVDPADITEAVENARKLTRNVALAAKVATFLLGKASEKLPKKAKPYALAVMLCAEKVEEGASMMLGKVRNQ